MDLTLEDIAAKVTDDATMVGITEIFTHDGLPSIDWCIYTESPMENGVQIGRNVGDTQRTLTGTRA